MTARNRGFTLVELMIVVAIIGILSSVAIPRYGKFQARSKQSEVKANLRALYTAQKAWLQEKDAFSANVVELGFQPERGNRYAYYLAATQTCQTRNAAALPSAPTGGWNCVTVDTFRYANTVANPAARFAPTVATASPWFFTATAAGNVDNDTTVDQWSVSSVSRTSGTASTAGTLSGTTASGSCRAGANPAGEPCNDQNDETL